MKNARAWVGCLACYNDGRLVGDWCEPEEATDWTCNDPSHEETWCFDIEGLPQTLLHEMAPVSFADICEQLDDISDDEIDAYDAYLGLVGADYGTPEGFRDSYQGEWDSEEDFARELAEDLGLINDDATWPNSCIDWEEAAGELFMGDYASVRGHGSGFSRLYVFNNNA